MVFLALTSCYYDVESELYPSNCTTPQNIAFSVDVSPIISQNCAVSGCHVPGGITSINFQNTNELMDVANNGTLYNEVVLDMTMPPNSSLAPCDQEIIAKWIEAGAPNN